MDSLQPQRNKLDAYGEKESNSESIAELFAGGEVLRAGSTTESFSFHCFTSGGLSGFCLVVVLCLVGAVLKFWFLFFVVLLPGSPLLLHWDAQDYPLSTTATIVIMSAAQEPIFFLWLGCSC